MNLPATSYWIGKLFQNGFSETLMMQTLNSCHSRNNNKTIKPLISTVDACTHLSK